jgi:ketosteroid isomerase-like protein
VEIVRRLNEAINRWDIAGVVAMLDPECEWWDREDDPGAGVHRGHDGVRAFLADLDEVAELRVEAKEFIHDGDYVLVPVRLGGRGRASGIPFDEKEIHAFRLHEGKVTEVREYRDMSEALKAVGLAE